MSKDVQHPLESPLAQLADAAAGNAALPHLVVRSICWRWSVWHDERGGVGRCRNSGTLNRLSWWMGSQALLSAQLQ